MALEANLASKTPAPAETGAHDHLGFFATFGESFLHAAVQDPVTGVLQLGNHMGLVSDNTVTNTQFVPAPEHQPITTLNGAAEAAGKTLGTLVPFLLTSLAFDGALSRGLKSTTLSPILHDLHLTETGMSASLPFLAMQGATAEALFTPVDKSRNFWLQRFANTAAGAVGYAAMGHFTNRHLPETPTGLFTFNRGWLDTRQAEGLGAIASVASSKLVRTTFSGDAADELGVAGKAMRAGMVKYYSDVSPNVATPFGV